MSSDSSMNPEATSKSKSPEYGFFDPQMKPYRQSYFKLLVPVVLLIVIVMWATIPVYFGSLAGQQTRAPQLQAWLINWDGDGALGKSLESAFLANSNGEHVPKNMHLSWSILDQSEVGNNQKVIEYVTEEKVWAVVVVNQGATSRLVAARSSGDPSYDPSSAVTFYYAQGRNEVAVNSFVVPLTTTLLQKSVAQFSAQFTSQYFNSLESALNTNTTAAASMMQNNARAPLTISQPFGFTAVNLRPYTKPVTMAILLVGQIYVIIFAFIFTMAHAEARSLIAPHLSFRSYAIVRVVLPLLVYIPLSFSYAMISLPFKLTFDAKFSYAGGFFIYWLYNYMGMASLGLATEAMLTALTQRFVVCFIISLIISNVSTASLPVELQPGFYRYGLGFPVYNLGHAVRTIVFNTKNTLGKDAAILLGWIVLSCITIPVFTWIERRRRIRTTSDAKDYSAQQEIAKA
ncbi:hypothetical protein FRC02_011705 [Tulasnella sp. 418]|nr:hypothetical protein FRC02_011705 [Tulasnella sp. 418]